MCLVYTMAYCKSHSPIPRPPSPPGKGESTIFSQGACGPLHPRPLRRMPAVLTGCRITLGACAGVPGTVVPGVKKRSSPPSPPGKGVGRMGEKSIQHKESLGCITVTHMNCNQCRKTANQAIQNDTAQAPTLFSIDKKATVSMQRVGLPLPGDLHHTNGFVHCICDSGSKVGMRFENVTRSQYVKATAGQGGTGRNPSATIHLLFT